MIRVVECEFLGTTTMVNIRAECHGPPSAHDGDYDEFWSSSDPAFEFSEYDHRCPSHPIRLIPSTPGRLKSKENKLLCWPEFKSRTHTVSLSVVVSG